jgi:hypothetical protein
MRVDARGIAATMLERLPSTFDESWLRSTWSGGHGRLRLRAALQEVTSSATLTEGSLSATARISGKITRRSGTPVGTVTRRVDLHPNGRLGVYHAYLKLDDTVHRSGFASRFNDSAYRAYGRAGVDDVTVSAALSAGGYVWARTGFELAPVGAGGAAAEALERARSLRSLVETARSRETISAREFNQLAPRLLGQDEVVHEHTLTSIRELAAMDGIGERVLKGQSWRGLREIETPGPWWTLTQRQVPAGIAQADAGVAHLRPRDAEPEAVEFVRRSVASQLPAALEPSTLTRELERATAGRRLQLIGTGDASTAVDLIHPQVQTSAPFRVIDDSGAHVGTADISVSPDDSGLLVARSRAYVPDGVNLRPLSAATTDALRGAGVARIT